LHHDGGVSSPEAVIEFVNVLEASLGDGSFRRLLFAKPRVAADGLRVTVRELIIREQTMLSFVTSFATNDVTKNVTVAAGLDMVRALLADAFLRAHLTTAAEQIDLSTSKKGSSALHRFQLAQPPADPTVREHDRAKHRFVPQDRRYLVEVGITDRNGRVIPAMARKWKQINKFVEIVDGAVQASSLATCESISVVDFGSGKGYLTFALHDHLTATLGKSATVHGVEMRPGLVDAGNLAARRIGLSGLTFLSGSINDVVVDRSADIVVALHACDTATDDAIHQGIVGGAQIIVASPCCHKELRAQMASDSPLAPMLRFGVHLGQEADMVTDTLRALILEANGYDAKVFEFIGLEETSKNKMILAVKRSTSKPDQRDRAQGEIAALKAFYGITSQHLETLLSAS
jgi:2-polyprenyl-3-methyl-5-hydroxy-6-metoxy-1,4-benzoquinol methylase